MTVRQWLAQQLSASHHALIVSGYGGLLEVAKLLDGTYEWLKASDGHVDIMLGNEPNQPTKSTRHVRMSVAQEADRAITQYWFERGIDPTGCRPALRTIDLIRRGIVTFRANFREETIHAKIYVLDDEALLGSSNASRGGLELNLEGNKRIKRNRDPRDYREARQIAENCWTLGEAFNDQVIKLLGSLFDVVSPEQALARACLELTEGGFASNRLRWAAFKDDPLLPHQVQGLDQAAYVLSRQGGVLIADPPGSGKTVVAAALLGVTLSRLEREDEPPPVALILCPPNTVPAWRRWTEGMAVKIHGFTHLQHNKHRPHVLKDAERCSVLVIDEAHKFTGGSKRAQTLLEVPIRIRIITSATPAYGVGGMMQILEMVGTDNLSDEVIKSVAKDVAARRRGSKYSPGEQDLPGIRNAFSQIMVRRSREEIGDTVEHNRDAYTRDGQSFRWPHAAYNSYVPVGGESWLRTAHQISNCLDGISGLSVDQMSIAEHWRLEHPRLTQFVYRPDGVPEHPAGRGLIRHNIIHSLLSSRAAAISALRGAAAASKAFQFGSIRAPDELESPIREVIDRKIKQVQREQPYWKQILAALSSDLETVDQIAGLIISMPSDADNARIQMVLGILQRHRKVVVYDRSLATLGWLADRLERDKWAQSAGLRVILAAGKYVQKGGALAQDLFDPRSDNDEPAVVLTGQALAEGVNLQKASAVFLLSLPYTPTEWEQILGRIDRIDSPHSEISIYYPRRIFELPLPAHKTLLRRMSDTRAAFGVEHDVPDLGDDPEFEETEDFAEQVRRTRISDALDPVRQLTAGSDPLISPAVYAQVRHIAPKILGAKIAIVPSLSPWGFLCLGGRHGRSPQWVLFEDNRINRPETDPREVAKRLRVLLNGHDLSVSAPFDEAAQGHLESLIERINLASDALLPLATRRALTQMKAVVLQWAIAAHDDMERSDRLAAILSALASDADPSVDRLELGRAWSACITPFEVEFRRSPYRGVELFTSKLLTDSLETTATMRQDEILAKLESSLKPAADLAPDLVAFIIGLPPA